MMNHMMVNQVRMNGIKEQSQIKVNQNKNLSQIKRLIQNMVMLLVRVVTTP